MKKLLSALLVLTLMLGLANMALADLERVQVAPLKKTVLKELVVKLIDRQK